MKWLGKALLAAIGAVVALAVMLAVAGCSLALDAEKLSVQAESAEQAQKSGDTQNPVKSVSSSSKQLWALSQHPHFAMA